MRSGMTSPLDAVVSLATVRIAGSISAEQST
jgi:hypothetical protein